MSTATKAKSLCDRALNDPTLINNFSENTFFSFVMGVAKFDKKRAIKLEELKPFTNSSNKTLFWEAVGLLFCPGMDEDYGL
jgi:hypothetical protein